MRGRVLVVEDEPAIRRMVAVLLRGLGCETFTAPDAESANNLLERTHPDVVLADVRLPGKDGTALCADIRQRADMAKTHVILMSAFGEPRGHTADEFLAKPFDPDSLEASVRRYIPDGD
jgi:DNA-binding response OmpR family regulator